MENPDYSNLSEQTKLEMELGRKTAAANAAAFKIAEEMRAAEAAPPPETDEAKAAAEAAQPVAGLPPVEEREPVFPVAGRKVKGNSGG